MEDGRGQKERRREKRTEKIEGKIEYNKERGKSLRCRILVRVETHYQRLAEAAIDREPEERALESLALLISF